MRHQPQPSSVPIAAQLAEQELMLLLVLLLLLLV